MNRRNTACAVLALGLAALAGQARADSLWQRGEKAGHISTLYSDHRASTVGAIVYVLVSETSTATSEAKTETDRKSESTNAAGTGLLSFLPFFSWNNAESFAGTGSTTRKGSLTGRITARLVEEVSPGVFRIEGMREVAVNAEKQTMRLTGFVRAEDISSANTIRSDQVADAAISYSGLGPIARKQKPGVLTRLLDWLF
jgi:flagellar L-ring protein precursor FlgH